MKDKTTIRVSERVGHTIHTRDASNHLWQMVAADHGRQIEFDFSGVDYISRSFAHQFHAGKIKPAAERQKSIIVTNANTEVANMLQAVAETQNKTASALGVLPVYKFSTWSQLENFLLSI